MEKNQKEANFASESQKNNLINMFIPIAIRVLSEDSVGKRKLKANKFYYFVSGFRIENNDIYIKPMRLETDKIYNDYFNDDKYPKIGVSAIVGENGSGKSSLIEFYLRLINNFAAITMGEHEVSPGADHLHFIDNIDGEFYYMIDNNPYRLRVENTNVALEYYVKNEKRKTSDGWEAYKLYNPDLFESVSPKYEETYRWRPYLALSRQNGKPENKTNLKHIYEHLFYSFVSNYSSYAYNTNDFADECNSNEYENQIRGTKVEVYPIEERNWLHGIFYKNDGYQVPIVLSPFRSKGNIDINKENALAKERLLALIIMPDSQFREINEHLEIKNFDLRIREVIYNADYLRNHLGFKQLNNEAYDKFQEAIVRWWGKCIEVDLNKHSSRKYFSQAIGYLTYKTLKICSTYEQYEKFFKKFESNDYSFKDKDLEKLIGKLSSDKSHITKKIRQVLSYIVYGIYDRRGHLDTISYLWRVQKRAYDILDQKPKFVTSIDDLIPPPIFDTTICLKDKATKNDVKFETLSSGERQQVYSISSLLYHLSNINSVWEDGNNERIRYSNVNVIMEEIELYFHPELQRTFIKRLFDGIKQIEIPNIKNINICIVTHSPFILSDIPSRNILALKKDGKEASEAKFKTFGANIHEMLRDSFFLEKGSIGAYAEHVIKGIIEELNEKENENYSEDKEKQLWDKIMLIDEPIVKNTLLEDFYHKLSPKVRKELKIKELRKQIEELEGKKS